MMRFP
jgi:Zn finger protein HypA/HybF involved in hydrogenase expression